MPWNIIEDWESQAHMDADKTVQYFEGFPDDMSDRLAKAFELLSGSGQGEVRHSAARLVRALLRYIDE